MRDKHEDREDERDDGKDGEERLLIGQVLEGAALRGPRGAEAERDRADGAPYEERRDAGKVDEPREDDALAPDGGQERDERDAEGEPTSRGTSAPYMRRGRGCTYRSAGTGTPREVTHPKTLGACPFRARASSMRELAKKQELVADSTAVSRTALTTCVAAPNPARWKTTVSGDAATLESGDSPC